jgi:hypothetical protein
MVVKRLTARFYRSMGVTRGRDRQVVWWALRDVLLVVLVVILVRIL